MNSRQDELANRMIEIVDGLVDEFDFVDLAHDLASKSIQLLDATIAGVMVVDGRNELRSLAVEGDLESADGLFDFQRFAGPAFDCWKTGKIIRVCTAEELAQWPDMGDQIARLGFESLLAVPMRLRTQVLGVVQIAWTHPSELSVTEVQAAQMLADFATIGLIQRAAMPDRNELSEQVEFAVQGRVLIEQAKGMLAVQGACSIDEASALIVLYSGRKNEFLRSVAQKVVDRELSYEELSSVAPR